MLGTREGLGGEGGRQERSSGPNNPVQPDTRLAAGTMGGGGGRRWEVCNFQNTPPSLPQPPTFPKRKGTGAPLALVLLSSNLPPPQYPPPPFPTPPYMKFVKMQPSVLGILESKLDMFRSIEDQVSAGRVTVNCGRPTRANGGALGSQDRKDRMLLLQSPKS